MITIKGLTRRYGSGAGQHDALKDINLEIPDGQFVAIMGTSGSGKTTLLNIIGGLDRSWQGEVSVAGQSLGGLSDKALSRLRSSRFGFVFQHFNLLDHLTCVENVMLPGYFGGGISDGVARAKDVLRTVGLADKLGSRPTERSGGQKQRVAIARALFNRPKLIFCDEPTGSLDQRTGMQIMDLFQRLNEAEGLTLVVITHEEHISRMASRIVRLEDGAVVSDVANVPVRPEEQLSEGQLPEGQRPKGQRSEGQRSGEEGGA